MTDPSNIPQPRPEIVWWASQHEVSAPQKAVLFALSVYANDDGECYPSISTLASAASLGKSTVRKALRDLERCGLIGIRFRKHSGTNWNDSNYYVLHAGLIRTCGQLLGYGDIPLGDAPGGEVPQEVEYVRSGGTPPAGAELKILGHASLVQNDPKKERDGYTPFSSGARSWRTSPDGAPRPLSAGLDDFAALVAASDPWDES